MTVAAAQGTEEIVAIAAAEAADVMEGVMGLVVEGEAALAAALAAETQSDEGAIKDHAKGSRSFFAASSLR